MSKTCNCEPGGMFMVGLILGLVGAFIFVLLVGPPLMNVSVARDIMTLKENGVPVVMDSMGRTWGWDERNKVSYQILDTKERAERLRH